MLWLRVKIHEREVLCNPGLFTVLNSYERWFVCTKHAQKGAYLAYPSPVRMMTVRHYATGGGSISCIHVQNVWRCHHAMRSWLFQKQTLYENTVLVWNTQNHYIVCWNYVWLCAEQIKLVIHTTKLIHWRQKRRLSHHAICIKTELLRHTWRHTCYSRVRGATHVTLTWWLSHVFTLCHACTFNDIISQTRCLLGWPGRVHCVRTALTCLTLTDTKKLLTVFKHCNPRRVAVGVIRLTAHSVC